MAGRLLIVAAEFPPMKGIGRLRPLKFCQHLRKFGWETAVLAPREGDLEPFDPATLNEIPSDTKVYRAPLPKPKTRVVDWLKAKRKRDIGESSIAGTKRSLVELRSSSSNLGSAAGKLLGAFDRFSRRYLLIPDDLVLWTLPAIRVGVDAIAEFQPHVILATAPHFTNFVVGWQLARRGGLPWIADYRDLWTGDVLRDWVPAWRRRLEVVAERRIIGSAAAVITVSAPKTEFVRERVAGRDCSRFVTITNGFDVDEFEHVESEGSAPGKVRIVYAGRLFKNRRGYELIEAAGQVLAQHPEWRERLRIEYYGGVSPEIADHMQTLIANWALSETVFFFADVSYARSKALQKGADLLLLIVDRGETTSGVIPGKVFEYMAAKRPILCIAEPGATSDIVEQGNLGYVHAPGDVKGLAKTLVGLLGGPGTSFAPRESYVAQFDRRNSVEQLANLLEDVRAVARRRV